jgi:hypothetical protein
VRGIGEASQRSSDGSRDYAATCSGPDRRRRDRVLGDAVVAEGFTEKQVNSMRVHPGAGKDAPRFIGE